MNRSLETRVLKIACDIDGVISDFAGPFLEFYNHFHGTSWRKNAWTEWSLVESLVGFMQDLGEGRRARYMANFDDAFKAYCDADRFKDQREIEAGWDAVANLEASGYEVQFFTQRNPQNTPGTLQIYPVTGCTTPEDKAVQAAHWGADVFIDDRPDNYLEAQKAGIPLVILWATPYNAAWRERHTATGDLALSASDYEGVKWHIEHSMPVKDDDYETHVAMHTELMEDPRYGLEANGVSTINPLIAGFDRIVGEWRVKMLAKNHDYAGDSSNPLRNLKMCEACGIPGWQGVIVRKTDKISRLQSFMRQGELQVKDESVIDTFDDDGIYSILGRLLFEEAQRDLVGESTNE